MCSTGEINQTLANLDRNGIHVEFIGVKLKELDVLKFGEKIRALHITDCYSYTVHPVTRILHSTPNLKSFDCHLAEEDRTTRQFLKKLTIDLRSNDSKIENLENFKCLHGDTWGDDGREDLPFNELYRIFPRLKSIHFPIIDLYYLTGEELKMKTDLEEVSGAQSFAQDQVTPQLRNFLKSMPKYVHARS